MLNGPNAHRYVYGVLAALLTVLALVQTGAIPLLAALPTSWTWAPLALVLLIAFLKDFLPRIQSPTPEPAAPAEPALSRDPVLTIVPLPSPLTTSSPGGKSSASAIPPRSAANDPLSGVTVGPSNAAPR